MNFELFSKLLRTFSSEYICINNFVQNTLLKSLIYGRH